jgi:hypothetical protein
MTTDFDTIPKERLRCMIVNIARLLGRTRIYRGCTLRYIVSEAFGCGATTAASLCFRADLQPLATLPLKP